MRSGDPEGPAAGAANAGVAEGVRFVVLTRLVS
jgi:hypothetical protein